MAKNNNLTDFLTDVADAIRAKKGTTAKINPQDFSTEIASIEGGGSTDPTAQYAQHEYYTLAPGESYDFELEQAPKIAGNYVYLRWFISINGETSDETNTQNVANVNATMTEFTGNEVTWDVTMGCTYNPSYKPNHSFATIGAQSTQSSATYDDTSGYISIYYNAPDGSSRYATTKTLDRPDFSGYNGLSIVNNMSTSSDTLYIHVFRYIELIPVN